MTDFAYIAARQADHLAAHGKYEKFDHEGAEVHEYVGPAGPGYIVFEFKTEGGVDMIKATDFGQEGRSFDWQAAGG